MPKMNYSKPQQVSGTTTARDIKKQLLELGFTKTDKTDTLIINPDANDPSFYGTVTIMKSWVQGEHILHWTLRNNSKAYIEQNKKSLIETKDFDSIEKLKAFLLGD